jgi:molybdenum cofactor cytidylyltransferase
LHDRDEVEEERHLGLHAEEEQCAAAARARLMGITGLLLAAGRGTRFGGGKLTHALPGTDTPLVVAAWNNLRAAIPDACAVVRSGDAAVLSVLTAAHARVVVCDDAAEGMARSLACGVRGNAYATGWIVALGDMPAVSGQTLRRVVEALRAGAPIVVPVHAGRRGHPVGFSARFYGELVALRGDVGARDVLRAYADEVIELDVRDPGILADVDTRDDLAALSGVGGTGST